MIVDRWICRLVEFFHGELDTISAIHLFSIILDKREEEGERQAI